MDGHHHNDADDGHDANNSNNTTASSSSTTNSISTAIIMTGAAIAIIVGIIIGIAIVVVVVVFLLVLLVRRYRAVTGKPLGITGGVAEYEAARILGVELKAGYDAVGKVNGWTRRLQIKLNKPMMRSVFSRHRLSETVGSGQKLFPLCGTA